MCQCIRAVVKFLNCAVYFMDDNSEKPRVFIYPGYMTVHRDHDISLEISVYSRAQQFPATALQR